MAQTEALMRGKTADEAKAEMKGMPEDKLNHNSATQGKGIYISVKKNVAITFIAIILSQRPPHFFSGRWRF